MTGAGLAGAPGSKGRAGETWRRRIVLALCIGLALVPLVRFGLDVGQGFDHLMFQFLADDAFYYFEIARHLPEFNDGIPTTGFHPLYAWLIAPLHRLLDGETAVVLSLLILVLCHSLLTFAVYLLAARYWSRTAALAAAGVWSVTGQLYGITMIGMESMLAVLLVLAALFAFSRAVPEQDPGRSRLPAAWFGLLLGLAFLARMDAPLFLGPFLLVLLVGLVSGKQWGTAVLLAGPPALILLAYCAYMIHLTGDLVPTSALAIRTHAGLDGQLLVTDLTSLKASAGQLMHAVSGFLVAGTGPGVTILVFVATCLAAILALLLVGRDRRRKEKGSGVFAAALVSGSVLWCSYYLFVQGSFKLWYFAYLAVPICCLVIPGVVDAIRLGFNSRLAASLSGGAMVAGVFLLTPPGVFSPQAYDKYHAALGLNSVLGRLPPDARIGAFNTGIYDYFCERDVINLDGVVNPRALQAWRTDSLPEFLRSEGIGYLIEHEPGQALNFERLYEDPRVTVSKVLDLRELYPPFGEDYAKDTFLWKVTFTAPSDESAGKAERR